MANWQRTRRRSQSNVHDSPAWQSVRLVSKHLNMSDQLQAAVAALTSTYQSLDVMARGWGLDAEEVTDALDAADPDTQEYVALTYLAKYTE